MIFRAGFGIDALRSVMQGGERVATEITLRTSRFLAQQANGFELIEQVRAAARDGEHAIDRRGEVGRGRAQQVAARLAQREIVGDADGIDAGRQCRLVGNGFDHPAVDIYDRTIATQ